MPSISTVFRGEVNPLAMRTEPDGWPVSFARNFVMASFALPSTGGAATCSFQTSPSFPANAVRFAPARILRVIRIILMVRAIRESRDAVETPFHEMATRQAVAERARGTLSPSTVRIILVSDSAVKGFARRCTSWSRIPCVAIIPSP